MREACVRGGHSTDNEKQPNRWRVNNLSIFTAMFAKEKRASVYLAQKMGRITNMENACAVSVLGSRDDRGSKKGFAAHVEAPCAAFIFAAVGLSKLRRGFLSVGIPTQ